MKAFALTCYGKTNTVAAFERARRELRDDDVLVQIHAASVNPLNVKIRNGELKPPLRCELPIVPGNELAGVVTGVIRSVMDRTFPFEATLDSPAYVEGGRAAGKVVVTMTDEGQRP